MSIVESLVVFGLSLAGARGLAELAKWEKVQAIDLTRTQVTSAGVAVLATLPKLLDPSR